MVCKGDVNVVCLKWGVKYPADYVNRLHRMVKRSLARPHRFVCLTDDPSDLDPAIETKPIENPELSGWWHKLTLFKPKFFDLEGPTLFLDLDLVIIDGLDNFFLYPGEFCLIRDWRPQEHNSSVFRIVLGTHPEVWEQFARNHESISGRLHGDQDWLREMLPVCFRVAQGLGEILQMALAIQRRGRPGPTAGGHFHRRLPRASSSPRG
jgi:hypothetical protein